jgi:hypothetical protein
MIGRFRVRIPNVEASRWRFREEELWPAQSCLATVAFDGTMPLLGLFLQHKDGTNLMLHTYVIRPLGARECKAFFAFFL